MTRTASNHGSLHGIETTMRFVATMVTPQLAQQFIDKAHPRQRREKPRKIKTFISDMEANRWVLSPDPICVSQDGETINGLNRCRAIVRSGKTVPLFVCYNVPEECFPCLDCGTPRNANDAAKITGLAVPSGYHGTARQMMSGFASKVTSYSIGYTLQLVSAYRDGLDYAFAALKGAGPGIATAATRAVIARAWFTAGKDRLHKFTEALVTGFCDAKKTDGAAILLRNWLLDEAARRKAAGSGGTGQKGRAAIYARTEFALDAFLAGVCPRAIIDATAEMFPLPDLENDAGL